MSDPTQAYATPTAPPPSPVTAKRKRTHSDASEHRPVKKAHLVDDAEPSTDTSCHHLRQHQHQHATGAGSTQESCPCDEEEEEEEEEAHPPRAEEVFDPPSCNICLDDLADGTLFRLKQCSHAFCRPCIAQWVKTQGAVINLIQDVLPSCPLCRNILPPDEVQELSRVIRKEGQKDLNKCQVRGCHAKVVNLERHRQRMHVPVACELCDVMVDRFSLKEHRRTGCNGGTDECPLPGCPVQMPRQKAADFLLRYWTSDETLGSDLIKHHHCVGVYMCVLCESYQYFLTHDAFHAHFNESHS